MRTVEPALALAPGRRLQDPDDGEDEQGDENRYGEEVLDESESASASYRRDEEALVEQVPVGLEDGEEQDGEAPEHEGMGDPGDGALEQLPLRADLGQLRVHAQMLEAVRVTATGGREPVEGEEAVTGDGECHHRDGYSYGIANWQGGPSWDIGSAAGPAAADLGAVCTYAGS